MKTWKNTISYGLGAFGHDAFYGILNTYMLMFITSILFADGSKHYAARMIAIVTAIIMVIRIVELILDPFIGSLIDQTDSKWGKYRPWIFGTGLALGIASPFLFTTFGGLSTKNGTLYLILFTIFFFVLYIVYAFKDISFWGLLPAMSLNSDDRGITATGARVGSTIGANIVSVCYASFLTFFSGSKTFNAHGWFMFALVIGITQLIGACFAAFGTSEKQSVVTNQNKEKITVKQVFHTLAHNDQLLWMSLAYLIVGLGNSATNNLLLYYFRYVLNAQSSWQYIGWIGIVSGFISIVSYPFIAKFLGRRKIMIYSLLVEMLGFIIFAFSNNVPMTLLGDVLYTLSNPLVFMVLILTIADSVEYGQWKTGHRSEAATSAVRPMLDKFNGAVATGLTGLIAGIVGMTGNATAANISAQHVLIFKTFCFYLPILCIIVGLLIFMSKVKLDEKMHEEIVNKIANHIQAEDNNN
ncbi:glycoside-pentoside-hexuronide (GPH):cation symporter [uncultured Limosilactobacillus sp.]|uniref:glycoside-pentoside-hexuronide (GPH):cation symporter n=1 Tax=uncultured Limosilactobacillus sp. TaxID=2837629 RepID=UPI0025EBCFA8|nr:glycoside-pentoside-hexuronide (GPH):cation symporter [uncultured Limosilactobacillus sp.]